MKIQSGARDYCNHLCRNGNLGNWFQATKPTYSMQHHLQFCGSVDNEISTFLAKWIVKNWQWNPDLIKAPSSAHKARYLKAQIGWMQHKIIDLKNSLQSEKFTNTQYNDFDCKQQLVIEYMQIVTIKSSMLCSWQWNLLTSTKYKHSICDLC